MKEFDFRVGTSIDSAAKEMAAYAIQHGDATATFNGITLLANKDSTPQGIVDDYHAQQQAKSEAWRNSPEGIAAARENEERVTAMQAKYDGLMEQLPKLDFTDQQQLLEWLCQLETTIIVGVNTDGFQAKVVEVFTQHGYLPGVNTGDAINNEDPDNVARYIIGQCLDTLNHGYIRQIVHKFTENWKLKFGFQTA
ncbi:MAG TPA: hypothetical protein VGN56_02510 [Candidatus Paceibacterota bacterium]|nr:hypothetical protein [Candidatus Paceibacterota bacterium]